MNEKIKINFPLHFERPKIDDSLRIYYLTINAILDKNNGVGEAVKIQEKVLEGINAQNLIGSGIYKYPADTVHFSIINFEGLSSKLENKDIFEKKRKSYIDKIKRIFSEFDGKQIKNKDVKFSYIYTKESPSIAIQAFPSDDLYKFFKEELEKKFNKEEELKPLGIKGYSYKNNHYDVFRFPTNIIRFFRKLSDKEYDIISRRVFEINEDSKDKDYLFSIDFKHLSFVLSDNWLSNKNPELSYIKLN